MKTNIFYKKTLRIASFLSTFLLLIIVLSAFFPITSQAKQVNAAESQQGNSIIINIEQNQAAVTLAVGNPNGAFAVSTPEELVKFSVQTSNRTGYTLDIAAEDDSGELSNSRGKFTSIDSAINSTTFNNPAYDGMWGFQPSKYVNSNGEVIDNTGSDALFLPSPTTTPTTLDVTTSANLEANSYTIGLAARAGILTPYGRYSKTIILRSFANPIPDTPDGSEENPYLMQDFTCDTKLDSIGDTAYVYDSRDGQTYRIGKLADGNCWMLDNLNLDITNNVVQANLSSTTTHANDISLEYLKGERVRNVKSDPNGNLPMSSATERKTDHDYDTASPIMINSGNCASSSECTEDTSDNTWNDESRVTNFGLGYGKVGTYYNYCAASAGSYCYGDGQNPGTPTTDAAEDICPIGWSLPSHSELSTLYNFYQNANAFKSALSVAYSGENRHDNYAFGQNTYSQIWSTTFSNETNMYGLNSSDNSTEFTAFSRYSGKSIRCINNSAAIPDITYYDYKIVFNPNAEQDNVSNLPAAYTATSTENSHTFELPTDENSIPSRTNYEFLGWANNPDSSTPNYAFSGSTFTPNSITVTNTTTIYAVWKFAPVATDTLQNYSCAKLSDIGDTEYVYDTRDNQTYLISKLADGNCWMLDNLNLDLTDSTIIEAISLTNTNIANENTLTSLINGNRAAGDQYATSGLTHSNWTTNPEDTESTNNYSSSTPLVNTKDFIVNHLGDGFGKRGVFYNLCAVSAGSYCYEEDTVTDAVTFEEDICPAGWRLPKSWLDEDKETFTSEYETLYNSYESDNAFKEAFSISFAGYIEYGLDRALDNQASYWIAGNETDFITFSEQQSYSHNTIYSQGTWAAPQYGYSARCIAK